MSGKIAGGVWDLDLPRNKAFVLLAMADHADHLGGNVFPSFGMIAWKTGYSYRQVLRIVKDLESDGILVLERSGKDSGKANRYRINLAAGKQKAPYNVKSDADKDRCDIIVSYPSDSATNIESDQQNVTPGVTPLRHTRCDSQMSHKPSIKPSIETSKKELADPPSCVQPGESMTDQKPINEPLADKPTAPESFKPIQELVITHWFKGDWANAGWAGDIANLFLGRSEAKQYIEYNFMPAFSVAEFTAFCGWLKGLGFALPTKPEKLRRYGMQYRNEHKPASPPTPSLSEDQMAALRREQFTMPDVLKGVSQS